MEKMSPQPQRSPSIVPLARDQDGNAIELPDGAVGWRVRRQTGGRPRQVLDSKKQPMLFPLDYTIADVEDILSSGSYLLDVVNQRGDAVGVTIGLSLGMPRNAESVEPADENDAPAAVPTTLPNTSSEVRLVLEANVRAMQMAFVHNQRTLELGLRMAETLRDGVQVLASAQADWIKSVSSARGFFRNAAQPLPPVEVKQLTVQTAGDEGDEDDGEDDDHAANGATAAPAHWSEPFVPIISSVVQQAGPAIMAWAAKREAGSGGGAGATRNGAADDDRKPGWELRDLVDLRYAQQKQVAYREKKAAEKQAAEEQASQEAAAAEHAERLRAAITAAWSPESGINPIKLLQLLPQRTAAKLMRIQAALSTDEQADAMRIFQFHDHDGLEGLLQVFDGASVEESVDLLRRIIADMRAARAANRAAPADPLRDDSAGGSSGNGSTEPG